MRVQSRFPPPLPLEEVDIEIEMAIASEVAGAALSGGASCEETSGATLGWSTTATLARRQDVGRRMPPGSRMPVLRNVACVSACGLSLVGCAMWQDAPASKPRAMSIEPVFRVDDAPLPLEAYLATARYFEGSREWMRAAEAYAKASARDPMSVEAMDGLGRMLASSGRLEAAEMTLRRAVALAPDRARPRNNLAYVLLLKDEPQKALVELDEALKRDPANARARENRDEALARLAAIRSTVVAANPPMAPSPGVIGEAQRDERPSPPPSPALREREPDSVLREREPDSVPNRTSDRSPPELLPRPLAGEGGGEGLLAPSPAPSLLPPVRLELSNGIGTTGLAAKLDRWMVAQGMPKSRLTNQPTYDVIRTRVDYRAGQLDAARRVIASLPPGVPAQLREQPGLRGDVRVVIGRDWPMPIAMAGLTPTTRSRAPTP